MTPNNITLIEQKFNVKLPSDLREFLLSERDDFDPDNNSILDDPYMIIDATREYQNGFIGLPKWPRSWIYIGDESDACPYYIDCDSGSVAQLHKGDLRQNRLVSYDTFTSYLENTRKDSKLMSQTIEKPWTWKDRVDLYKPVAFGLFLFFAILPLFAFSISYLFKWLFN